MMAEPQVVHKPQERMKEGHILQESKSRCIAFVVAIIVPML